MDSSEHRTLGIFQIGNEHQCGRDCAFFEPAVGWKNRSINYREEDMTETCRDTVARLLECGKREEECVI